MCGIYGLVYFDGRSTDQDAMRRCLKSLQHRGPDDEGEYRNQSCALGHRRLSIIDLETGQQPLCNEDKTIWVVCNGEIYNYRELTNTLVSQGHSFRTKSDSEVIVHLYEQHKERCVDYLNGIFAFAIWDSLQRKLFLARDHLGVKPLFFYQDDAKLIFGSEIKAILQDPTVKRKINHRALYHYLSLNYCPSPLTMFQSIHVLPAGHYLTESGGCVRVHRYWDVSFNSQEEAGEQGLMEQFRDLLHQSVKMQLMSDVPVGAFLSGGLDSSTIVRLASLHSRKRLKTFNVRFKESSYDESDYARLAAKVFGTEHFEIQCEAKNYRECIQDIIWHADNLTVDISMLPLYLVSKLAREHVKVVLSGDGADELLAGYPTYSADRLVAIYRKLPSFLRAEVISRVVHALPVSHRKMSFEFLAKRFIRGAELSPEEAHYSWRLIFSEDEKKELLLPDLVAQQQDTYSDIYEHYYEGTELWDRLGCFQYADIKGWLADSILAKVDSMSMAHALEVRVPFLNPDLVKFACRIPSHYKLRGLTPKYILKMVMQKELPRSILRRKKAGFQIPIGHWLRGELKEFSSDVLCRGRIERMGFLKWETVRKLMEDHFKLRKDHGYQLLSLLHLCLWHGQFMEEEIPAPRSSFCLLGN